MLYAIKITTGAWRMLRNKRDAIRWAKRLGKGAEVWAHADIPEVNVWDWPTFRISAKRIYPL